jgi:hypothetical protein
MIVWMRSEKESEKSIPQDICNIVKEQCLFVCATLPVEGLCCGPRVCGGSKVLLEVYCRPLLSSLELQQFQMNIISVVYTYFDKRLVSLRRLIVQSGAKLANFDNPPFVLSWLPCVASSQDEIEAQAAI